MNRKAFLQQTGMLAAAGMLYPALSRAGGFIMPPIGDAIGLQLYTVGALMEADTKGTLKNWWQLVIRTWKVPVAQKDFTMATNPRNLPVW